MSKHHRGWSRDDFTSTRTLPQPKINSSVVSPCNVHGPGAIPLVSELSCWRHGSDVPDFKLKLTVLGESARNDPVRIWRRYRPSGNANRIPRYPIDQHVRVVFVQVVAYDRIFFSTGDAYCALVEMASKSLAAHVAVDPPQRLRVGGHTQRIANPSDASPRRCKNWFFHLQRITLEDINAVRTLRLSRSREADWDWSIHRKRIDPAHRTRRIHNRAS